MTEPADLALLELMTELNPEGGPVDRGELVESLWRHGEMDPGEANLSLQRLVDEGLLESSMGYRTAPDGRHEEGRPQLEVTDAGRTVLRPKNSA